MQSGHHAHVEKHGETDSDTEDDDEDLWDLDEVQDHINPPSYEESESSDDIHALGRDVARTRK